MSDLQLITVSLWILICHNSRTWRGECFLRYRLMLHKLLPLFFSHADLETRYPEGQRVTHYRSAKLERFAPWISDGLVTRLTTYKDLDRE